jgi:hypothetical protein
MTCHFGTGRIARTATVPLAAPHTAYFIDIGDGRPSIFPSFFRNRASLFFNLNLPDIFVLEPSSWSSFRLTLFVFERFRRNRNVWGFVALNCWFTGPVSSAKYL